MNALLLAQRDTAETSKRQAAMQIGYDCSTPKVLCRFPDASFDKFLSNRKVRSAMCDHKVIFPPLLGEIIRENSFRPLILTFENFYSSSHWTVPDTQPRRPCVVYGIACMHTSMRVVFACMRSTINAGTCSIKSIVISSESTISYPTSAQFSIKININLQFEGIINPHTTHWCRVMLSAHCCDSFEHTAVLFILQFAWDSEKSA